MAITTPDLLGTTKNPQPVLSGARWRQGYKASVIGILGARAPAVYSKGSRFYNHDRWTARFLLRHLCEWASKNPGCVPTRTNVQVWVNAANAETVVPSAREIVIANTPDHLPQRTAMALTGGAYHEALHTYYSCLRNLTLDEIATIVIPRWAKVADWSKYHKALLTWTNLIEDIRIERRGRDQFSGINVKLHDLQDLILQMEFNGENDVRAHGGKPGALSVIERAFRDMGLGYNTALQVNALKRYQIDNARAYDLVLTGPLARLWNESVELSASDDLGCLRIGMDVITTLAELAEPDQDPDDQPQEQGCPKCGASAGKLRVHPKSDGQGGKIPNKGIVTCTVCGWQDEIDLQPQSQPRPGSDPGESPEFEGFDDNETPSDDNLDPSDKPGSKQSDPGAPKPDQDAGGDKSKDESEGDSEDDDSEDPTSSNNKGSETEDDPEDESGGDSENPGSPEGDDELDSEDGDSGTNGEDEDPTEDDSDSDDPGSHEPTDSQGDEDLDGEGGDGAGGFQDANDQPVKGDDWSDVAEDALNDADEDTGILDNQTALEESVNAAQGKEDGPSEIGEHVWKPYNPGLDHAEIVKPSAKGIQHDITSANQILKSVKKETAYLRSRLRTIVRSMEMKGMTHGVPKGRWLSDRYLVDTLASVRAGEIPRRAFARPGERIDMTMAAVAILDQSSSMDDWRKDATRILTALVEPLDGVGAATLAIGFRDGNRYVQAPTEEDKKEGYHRFGSIIYDIFKGWNERFHGVKWRFANTRATGGTPMADGMQYALKALSARNEAHRFMFVVTDGCPDGGHEAIIRRQMRLAKQAGIHIVGVGIGKGAQYVTTLFPDHVWANKVSELPKLLVDKLNDLVDVQAVKRGFRVATNG